MCLICERIRLIQTGENPYFVRALDTGFVVLGDHQLFRGYTLLLHRDHHTEIHQLARADRLRFLEEMAIVSEAVHRAFRAEKMNLELLGNSDAHLHWHIFPRRAGDLHGHGADGRGPVWWYPREDMYHDRHRPSSEELTAMKQALNQQLSLLL